MGKEKLKRRKIYLGSNTHFDNKLKQKQFKNVHAYQIYILGHFGMVHNCQFQFY